MGSNYDLVIIDTAILFRAKWHASAGQEVSAAADAALQRFRRWAREGLEAVAAIDSPPYWRKSVYPDYKAQREAPSAVMLAEYARLQGELGRDGFPLAAAPGMEADDVAATIAAEATRAGKRVLLVSGDRDWLQLLGERCDVASDSTEKVWTVDELFKEVGILPPQVPLWRALTGDASDNLPGVERCGPKTASAWISQHSELGSIIAAAQRGELKPPGAAASLLALERQVRLNLELITLRRDCAVEYTFPQPPPQAEGFEDPMPMPEIHATLPQELPQPEVVAPSPTQAQSEPQKPTQAPTAPPVPQPMAAEPTPTKAALTVAPGPWERGLEPTDMQSAWKLAGALFNSRLFGGFQSQEAVLAVILTGRSLGMDAVASLRSFHVIEGKACPSAQTLAGLAMRSPACRYLRLVESTDAVATYETHRQGHPDPVRMSFSMEDAVRMGVAGKGNWRKMPREMLRARAVTALVRAVYPDLAVGLYAHEELEG